ncbi:MAG: DUF3556 domain-containing protein [Actinobacteria bacterium]|nr:DUF3556 domain-containing protein [Actinomycetota bacterium]
MGWIQPAPPPVDPDQWKAQPYLARLKPLAQDWSVNGFGTPYLIYFLYLAKLVVFVVGAFALISLTTPGLGSLGEVGDWWSQPVAFQKLAAWTMLWEVIGLGSGSMPLTFRFVPPIGGILYWLRPGTVRLPPWPDRVPLTRGTTRTLADVALYAGVLAALVYLLVAGEEPADGVAGGRLDPVAIAVLLGLLALLGLRDKVSFLSARPEVYGFLMVIFLFPFDNLIVASQLVFVCIWWGAAASKLNRHFPFVVSVMISNTPWNRSRKAKAKLYRDYPEDLRPSSVAALAAHTGTVMEFGLPLLLLVSDGGTLGWIAVIGMVIFHLHITSTFPLAVPLEWNLFMIYGLFFLFGENGGVPLSTLDPVVLIPIVLIGVVLPVLGNLRPDLISFLPSMRYYAGNWATSQWLLRKDTGAEERLDTGVKKTARVVVEQVEPLYGRDLVEMMLAKGLAFRAMHSHGRALTGLLPRAAGGADRIDDFHVREGELISGVINGWNFGDGHFHGPQLIAAVQERCGFAPGDVRVITLESQPAHVQRQRYRIYDAATWLIEEGYVDVAEMVNRGPWLEESWEFPVEVTERPAGGAAGASAPPA